MNRLNGYLKSVAAGYRRLLSSIAGIVIAALLLALLSALIALPLWYLAIHTPQLFSWLVAAVILLWIALRRVPALLKRRRRDLGRAAEGRPFRRALRVLQLLLLAGLIYSGAGSIAGGMLPAGLLFFAAGLILLGVMVRIPG